jgi:hypothetical protein
MQVCKVELTIIDQNSWKGEISHKGYFIQSRNGNLIHITRPEDRWEQSTWKECGYRRRTRCALARWINVTLQKKDNWCQMTRSRGWLLDHEDKSRMKQHGKWRCSAPSTRLGNDNPDTDVQSDLTTRSSQKIQNWYCCGWIQAKSWIEKM